MTGARGYIGGRLVNYLLERGHAVTGTTRTASPPPAAWPGRAALRQVDHTSPQAGFGDVLEGIDCVVHLACANEQHSASDPDAAVIQTGLGTRRVIQACVDAKVRRFVYVSTAHVYGAPLSGDVLETDAVRPVHPYAIAHQLGESFTLSAHRSGAIEGVVARVTNGIGAPCWSTVDLWRLVGNDLARQAVRDAAVMVLNPRQCRDFVPLASICSGLELLCGAPAELLGPCLFNLGTGRATFVGRIAEMVAEALATLGGPAVRISTPAHPADTAIDLRVSVERLRRLGYVPPGCAELYQEVFETVRFVLANLPGNA